jgi:hypothetical protein
MLGHLVSRHALVPAAKDNPCEQKDSRCSSESEPMSDVTTEIVREEGGVHTEVEDAHDGTNHPKDKQDDNERSTPGNQVTFHSNGKKLRIAESSQSYWRGRK